MDLKAFREQLAAARRMTAVVGAATFHIQLPTDHAWRVAAEAHRDEEGRVMEAVAFRDVLDSALVGWEGVQTTDIDPDAAPEDLPFSAELRSVLLDHRQDIADALTLKIGTSLMQRRIKREAARKNSSGASSTT